MRGGAGEREDSGMTQELVTGLGREALWMTILVSGPILILGLVTGLLVGIFQATTQINEQTLAFVPKIVVVLVGALVFGPWMMGTMLDFTRRLLTDLPNLVR